MFLGCVMVRPASLVTILIMGLTTYLHLVVTDPVMYPLQFGLPLIPILALALGVFLYFADPEAVPL